MINEKVCIYINKHWHEYQLPNQSPPPPTPPHSLSPQPGPGHGGGGDGVRAPRWYSHARDGPLRGGAAGGAHEEGGGHGHAAPTPRRPHAQDPLCQQPMLAQVLKVVGEDFAFYFILFLLIFFC